MRASWVVSLCVLLVACGGGKRHRDPDPAPPRNERAAERKDDQRDARVEDSSRWEKLGERVVHGKGDRDVIQVGGNEGKFASVKLVVEHSALELWDVELTFGDGDKHSPGTRLVFGKNTTSRVIDLPGQRRVIRKVEFRYGNLPGGGTAQIELWAK